MKQTTLGDALPKEQARVRALVNEYRALEGGAGLPAALMMEQSLARAERAAMSGDVVQMLGAFQELQGWTG